VEQAIAELRKRAARTDARQDSKIPAGVYRGHSIVDSDGVVDEPLDIRLSVTKTAEDDLVFDFSGSSPPCRGPMNSVIATTLSSVYLAVKHVFPDVPINAGTYEPLKVIEPEGTFLYAKYPRPVSGCAAESASGSPKRCSTHSPRRFRTSCSPRPPALRATSRSAATTRNAAAPTCCTLFTGGGYGGSPVSDGISNGCSTIGISKMPPVEVMEQYYPVLFEEFAINEGSGGAGEARGGFGVNYAIRVRRGEARASMVMDHGRTGPLGALGGANGGVNRVAIERTARPITRSICPRTRTSRCAPVTWSASRRRAAAATATRCAATRPRWRTTSCGATTRRDQAEKLFGVRFKPDGSASRED
jgi:N-methylhydantoinase B